MKNIKRKRNFHSKSNENHSIPKTLLSSAIGAATGFTSFLFLLGIFSAVCAMSSTPLSLVFPATLASIYISAFICGFSSAKAGSKSSPWVCALLGTACFYPMLFLCSLPFAEESATKYALLLRLIIIPCSALGAFCGKKARPKKHKKRF